MFVLIENSLNTQPASGAVSIYFWAAFIVLRARPAENVLDVAAAVSS